MVEADTGSIGGSASHEFMVVAETGESAVVRCPSCGYAANVERAETRRVEEAGAAFAQQEMQEVATPGKHAVDEVARFLKVAPKRLVKTLIYETEKGLVVALVRGDREVNEIKLANHFDVQHLALASEEKVRAATGAPVGFAGPVGLKDVPDGRRPRRPRHDQLRHRRQQGGRPPHQRQLGAGRRPLRTGPTCCWSPAAIPARAATARWKPSAASRSGTSSSSAPSTRRSSAASSPTRRARTSR